MPKVWFPQGLACGKVQNMFAMTLWQSFTNIQNKILYKFSVFTIFYSISETALFAVLVISDISKSDSQSDSKIRYSIFPAGPFTGE